MPTGVYVRKPSDKRRNAGRKPTCFCGVCRVCKTRVISRRFRQNKRVEEGRERVVSDEELERRLNSMFEERGWA